MTPRDFAIMMICCLFWAGNFVVIAWAVGNNPVPPLMLAAARGAIILLLLGPYLFKPFPGLGILCICVMVGPLHLGFLYTGLQTTSATAASILAQLVVPMATLLSVFILKERVGWIRSLAITGAFIGVMIMIFEPGSLSIEAGLILLLGAYIAMALASVFMKRVPTIPWQQYIAWFGFMLVVVMTPASLIFETGHAEVWAGSKWPFLFAAAYSAVAVSLVAHGQYFSLIQKYDISQVVPLALTQPIFATILGVTLLGDELFPRYIIGAAIILPCAYLIAKRSGEKET